jgi:hypothetical protein
VRLAIPLPSSHVLGPQMVAKVERILEVLLAVSAVVVLIAIVVFELLVAVKQLW